MLIQSLDEVEHHIAQVRESARRTVDWLAAQQSEPLALMRLLKFDRVGCHPVEDRPLNFVEQLNQTWTYLAALAATRWLLAQHPEAEGFRLAPGARAAQDLDVMSVKEGLVGAETFAAVHPDNNDKLNRDLEKLADRSERHRYVFFISPLYPGTEPRPELQRLGDGIQVWSVHAD